jgi:TonB family protein
LRLACTPIFVFFAAQGALAQPNAPPLDVYSGDSALRREPAATVFPEYPEEARLFRLEGETTVCFRINAQGEVVRPKVTRSTHRIFERPSLRAIHASAFTPLEAGESASPFDVCRVYRFRLNPVAAPTGIP